MATIHANSHRLRRDGARPRRHRRTRADETQRGERESTANDDHRVGDEREHEEEVGGDVDVGHVSAAVNGLVSTASSVSPSCTRIVICHFPEIRDVVERRVVVAGAELLQRHRERRQVLAGPGELHGHVGDRRRTAPGGQRGEVHVVRARPTPGAMSTYTHTWLDFSVSATGSRLRRPCRRRVHEHRGDAPG